MVADTMKQYYWKRTFFELKLKTLSDPCSPTGITADSCVQGNIVLVLSGRKLERRVEILLVAFTHQH